MTQVQWMQVALALVGVLVAAVVIREGVRVLRRDVDVLSPKVEALEKLQSRELADINLKLAPLAGLPSRLGELSKSIGDLDRKVERQTPRAEKLAELERELRRNSEMTQDIRLKLAEAGIRTRTPVRGVPTLAPPVKRDSDEGSDT